jgi:hypothetical protein
MRLLQSKVLFVVHNNYPGQQDFQISRQLNTRETMKRELILSPEPATTIV